MDQRETLGIDEYMRASAVPGVKTAYETSQVIAGRTLRLGEKPELVGDFIEEIGIKDIAMMKEYYDQPKVVQMTKDPAQGPIWMEVTRDQLQGEHQVSLHAGSAMPRDEQTDWQRGMALYQTFAGDPMVPHGQLLDVVMSLMRVPRKGALVGPAMGQQQSAGRAGPGVNPFSQAQGQGQPTQPTDILRRLWGGGR